VLIFGASGYVGSSILKELLRSPKFEVSAFVRTGGSKVNMPGVKIVEGDLDDHRSLVMALTGVNTVIIALSRAGLESQLQILSAAKEAGVRRFVPSDFGYHYTLEIDGYNGPYVHPFVKAKKSIRQAIQQAGLEYTIVYNGNFIDFASQAWAPFLNGENPDHVKAVIPGDGKAKVEWITVVDTARYLVASLSDSISKNAELYLSGDYKSYNEVVDLYEKYSGKRVEREYKPVVTLKKLILNTADPDLSFIYYLFAAFAEGKYQFPMVTNEKFPDIKPADFE
ncbi:NAD(P)-binding protein, partial [Basidiobolus meristosporus CBS 931.73]